MESKGGETLRFLVLFQFDCNRWGWAVAETVNRHSTSASPMAAVTLVLQSLSVVPGCQERSYLLSLCPDTAMAITGPERSQESGAPCRPPTWTAGKQTLGHLTSFSQAFNREQDRNWCPYEMLAFKAVALPSMPQRWPLLFLFISLYFVPFILYCLPTSSLNLLYLMSGLGTSWVKEGIATTNPIPEMDIWCCN